ncbi:D-alanine--D-alanine ligase [Solemya pervernicosa gill symbiont]|uniref:D-alanine--D-alanine ligase n=2 Tax=Gammaproteobacteria incertae sedis TaxID=118884 RepID=A0A1T2LA79_9GAMM|nr:D-alanine--D-alanine ligase [Candidatus Reidiella endopervernicosa]OOZ41846.1 D-alanine--D-alanine ligase [Solemya pervernicosa gill symbiont]QKQ26203.1 D-alanine--D-alanine ligase [Candidatus Reidiella endopervernicosa]
MSSSTQHTPADYGKVAVLMGGDSAEREVSLNSGGAVLAALQSQGVDAQGVDFRAGMLAELAEAGFDRVFIVLHGRMGEDGVVQGALELLDLPYTGSGVLGSALGMDKLRCKKLWTGSDLPTPKFLQLRSGFDAAAVVAQLGLPLMVKPGREGSSIGMSRVERVEDLEAAFNAAVVFDEMVFAEQWISGGEYTVALLGGETLPPIRLETPHAFYDYKAKYQADDTSYHCPCGLDSEDEQQLRALALAAFNAAGAEGWGRVDFMRDEQGAFWLIEVNTVPGMTDHSLVPMAATEAGINFEKLVLRILDTSFDGVVQ